VIVSKVRSVGGVDRHLVVGPVIVIKLAATVPARHCRLTVTFPRAVAGDREKFHKGVKMVKERVRITVK
jgi:hypothetical protein